MTSTPLTKLSHPSLAFLSHNHNQLPALRLNKHDQWTNQQNKENGDSHSDSSLLRGWLSGRNEEVASERVMFQIPSEKVINYDHQLKEYMQGGKPFKEEKQVGVDFGHHDIAEANAIGKPSKHQRNKSKSQVNSQVTCQQFGFVNSIPFSNNTLIHNNHASQVSLLKKGSFKRSCTLQSKVSQFRRKAQKIRKSIKFWQVKEEKFRQVQLKSLQMQLIVKRANEKRKSMIKDIIKKLHLPQVSPRLSNSLRMLVQSYPMKEEMRSEHSGQVAKGRTKRLTLNKGVSSMKSQEVKVKEVRKIEKETYQNKVNFNRLRDEVSARGQGVRKEDGLENYRIFGR